MITRKSTHKTYWTLFVSMFFACIYILNNIAPTHLSFFPKLVMHIGIILLSGSVSFGAMREITKQLLEFNGYFTKAKESDKQNDN